MFCGSIFGATIPERSHINAGEKILARTHENRTKCKVQFIDKPCAKVLLNRCNTPADAHVPPVCSAFGMLQCSVNSVCDKVKGCATLHLNRLPWIVRQHEYRDMIGWFVAPPSLPGLVRPWAAHRSKHVSAENPGPDVFHASLGPFVIDTSRAAFLALHLLPGPRGEEPLEQLWTTNAKRIVESLMRPSTVTIKRYRKRTYANFRHDLNLSGDARTGQSRSDWGPTPVPTCSERLVARKLELAEASPAKEKQGSMARCD